jgi:hypothetical protein
MNEEHSSFEIDTSNEESYNQEDDEIAESTWNKYSGIDCMFD